MRVSQGARYPGRKRPTCKRFKEAFSWSAPQGSPLISLWVGGNDRRLNLFENIFPIPRGVSYNSYLLLDDKTVLVDTVDKAVTGVFFDNLTAALDGRHA